MKMTPSSLTGQCYLLWIGLVDDDLRQCLFNDPLAGMGPFHLALSRHLPPRNPTMLGKQRSCWIQLNHDLREAIAIAYCIPSADRIDHPACTIHRGLHAHAHLAEVQEV